MKYSKGFRATIVKKTLDEPGKSISQIAKENNIYPATLGNWIKQYEKGILSMDGCDGIAPSRRHPGEKLALLLESKAIEERELGGWLRRHGLHSEHLSLWEQELTNMANDKNNAATTENTQLKKENKRLRKELKRKEKALAEAAILLTLKKKFPNLYPEDEGN
jgi:transposase-like protein